MISYQFLHLTIIQGYSKLSLLDKGFPKGGGGGPTFGKNSQIISFFFFESVPKSGIAPPTPIPYHLIHGQ